MRPGIYSNDSAEQINILGPAEFTVPQEILGEIFLAVSGPSRDGSARRQMLVTKGGLEAAGYSFLAELPDREWTAQLPIVGQSLLSSKHDRDARWVNYPRLKSWA